MLLKGIPFKSARFSFVFLADFTRFLRAACFRLRRWRLRLGATLRGRKLMGVLMSVDFAKEEFCDYWALSRGKRGTLRRCELPRGAERYAFLRVCIY